MDQAQGDPWDVLVIGAGQAGLALGRLLVGQGLRLLLVDAASQIGSTWRDRWDSLRLFTPAAYSALPGLPFPGPPDAYPGKDDVADYLQAYQQRFDLPVRLGTPVLRLAAHPESYAAHTPSATLLARQVVLATGPFQHPKVPAVSHDLRAQAGDTVAQVHSSSYRRPEALPDGPVLVVGGGNSGVQIADELRHTRPTTLAVGSRLPALPQRVAGRSVFWWLDRIGVLAVPIPPPISARLRGPDVLIGCTPGRLRRHGATLTGRVVAAEQGRLRCEDGSLHRPRTVVWTTGFGPDFSWIDLPVVAPDGWIRQRGGRTRLPGLYTLGLPWQHSAGSALLGWVGRDAARLADDIMRRHRAVRRS